MDVGTFKKIARPYIDEQSELSYEGNMIEELVGIAPQTDSENGSGFKEKGWLNRMLLSAVFLKKKYYKSNQSDSLENLEKDLLEDMEDLKKLSDESLLEDWVSTPLEDMPFIIKIVENINEASLDRLKELTGEIRDEKELMKALCSDEVVGNYLVYRTMDLNVNVLRAVLNYLVSKDMEKENRGGKTK